MQRPLWGLLVISAINFLHNRMDGKYFTSTLANPAEYNASFNQEIVAAPEIPHGLPDGTTSLSPVKKPIIGNFSWMKGIIATVSIIKKPLVTEWIRSKAING